MIFSSFKNQGSEKTSPVRTLYEAYWTQEKERFTFTIRGDGFLYRMVRNIVGCLVKVGTGEWTVADFAAVMAAKDRKKAGVAAACLWIIPGSRILPGRDCREIRTFFAVFLLYLKVMDSLSFIVFLNVGCPWYTRWWVLIEG